MSAILKRTLLAIAAGAVAGCATFAMAHATGEQIGDTQMCVPLQAISQTPVIDDKTILIKMKGKSGYKRIDLLNRCSGLKIRAGFTHTTSTNNICTTDPLRVIDPVGGGWNNGAVWGPFGPLGATGSTCMIDKIVTIDEAEAKQLMARR